MRTLFIAHLCFALCVCISGCQNKLVPDDEMRAVFEKHTPLKERHEYFIGGCIAKPGMYRLALGEGQTLTKAILKAGGFRQRADKENVLLARKDKKGNYRAVSVDAYSIFRSLYESAADLSARKSKNSKDPEVLPGDIILVKERDWWRENI